ncbi:MAG: lysophospholipid acyltransferase family protein [Gammaproteobacteria bacterium]|nr:lysophospholipid acyltransferase family protein [Gammaproteobacteria bacterium]
MTVTKRIKIRLREPLSRWFIKLLALLPLPLNHGFAWCIGRLLILLPNSLKTISQTNINLCFPQMSVTQAKQLCHQSLIETAKAAAETGPLWLWPKNKALGLIKQVSGEEHVTQALAQGKGVIIIAPHLACWEAIGMYLTPKYPMTTLYRPHPIASLDSMMRYGRERMSGKLAPTDASGVRVLMQALKKGEIIGILPDQDPGHDGGEFAPFFNIQANTITLLAKLAHKTQAAAIPAYAERLSAGCGYHLRFFAPPAGIADADVAIALTSLNQCVEDLIRRCPSQYQWGYKRFRTRPEGEKSFY